ncbi:MAG: glycosyltransferase family 4 protein [Candidatus Tectomicrobia bacterium]|nr:glycosyltransferase family 4 protein [Candidatus Tectomicrobia bacterium]
MHIAFFNRSFYPDIAATGQLLTELCEDLVQVYGCRVSVVAGVPLSSASHSFTHTQPGWLFDREHYRGVDILRARGTRFPKQHVLGRGCNYLSYFLSACYAGLRLQPPDVIVALTDPPIIGLAAYLASRRFGAPLIISYRDIFPEAAWILEDFQSPVVNHALQRINCFLVQKSSRLIALGDTMRQRLIEGKGADPAKTVVIPDWADCEAIAPSPKRNAFALEHDLADAFVIMHAGNIGLSQGLETLIEAAVHLQVWPDIRIVLVGDGVKKPALQEQVRHLGLSNVRFIPFQPKESLRHSYASADVFVISLKQGLAGYIVPSKLYSILAAGRPYVAAVEPDCEVTAITQQYGCGLCIEPGHAQGLAEAILRLYHNRTLAQRLGQNARRAALAFDRRRHVRAYYDLFQTDIEEPRLAA